MNHTFRAAAAALLVFAATAQAAEREANADADRAVNMVVIGAFGLLTAGGYTLGASLTGDQPSGFPLAIVGGVAAGGALGWWLGTAANAGLQRPRSTVGLVLLPLLSGLAGSVVGGVAAGFGGKDPGSARTATHAIVIGVLITDTFIAELVELAR